MRKMILSIIQLWIIYTVNGQVTVSGTAYLEYQSNHSQILITFERLAPSSLTFTTNTDSTGQYIINIQTGVYRITFSKNNYYNDTL